MRDIILQHYTGKPGELEQRSILNISNYAKSIGADYKFIAGQVFRDWLTPPCQKLIMLDEQFDYYENVVMLDIDMFVRDGMRENIFEVEGNGMRTTLQLELQKKMYQRFPHLVNLNYPYRGGAIWKYDRKERQLLRRYIIDREMAEFNGNYEDEGIFHRLCVLSGFQGKDLPGGFKWCYCSYRKGVESAAMIHIRTKVTPTGPKRPKMENYLSLVNRGLICEI